MFNCPDVSPTIEQIDQSFGATRPGVYDEERRRFTLTFRGLAFEFPAETKFQPSYGGSRRELGRLQFPPGQSPTVSHMIIISPSSPSSPSYQVSPPPSPTCQSTPVQVWRIARLLPLHRPAYQPWRQDEWMWFEAEAGRWVPT